MYAYPETHQVQSTKIMVINELRKSHVHDVVNLHCRAFPGYNITLMGKPFIRVYYLTSILFPAGVGMVAVEEGRVVAFVSGTIESPSFLWQVFLQSPAAFVLGTMRIFAMKPTMVVEYVKKGWRYLLIVLSHLTSFPSKEQKTVVCPAKRRGYLCSIAVDPEYRGSGAGGMVTEHFLDQMRAKGVGEVYTSTDEDNASANRFFRKVGFEFIGSHQTERDRVSNRYVYRW